MKNRKKIFILISLIFALVLGLKIRSLKDTSSTDLNTSTSTQSQLCDITRVQAMAQQIKNSPDPLAEYKLLKKHSCLQKKFLDSQFEYYLRLNGFCMYNEHANTPEELLALIQKLTESGTAYAEQHHPRACETSNYTDLDILKAFNLDWSKSKLNESIHGFEVKLYSSVQKDNSTYAVEGPTLIFGKWMDSKWRRSSPYEYPCDDLYSSTYSNNQPERYLLSGNLVISTASSCGTSGLFLGDGLSADIINKYSKKFLVYEDGETEELSAIFNNMYSHGRYAEYPFLRSLNSLKKNPKWIVFGGENSESEMKSFKFEEIKEEAIQKPCPGIDYSYNHILYKSKLLNLTFYLTGDDCAQDEEDGHNSFGIIKNNRCNEIERNYVDCIRGGYSKLQHIFKIGPEVWMHFHAHDGDTDSDSEQFRQFDVKTQKFVEATSSK